MQISFQGRTALVTGGGIGIGIGQRIALDLAQAGARAVAADIDKAGLQRTQGFADREGVAVETWPVDVTSLESIRALLAEIGPVDILVHSAGGVCGQVGRPLDQVTLQDWQAILAVNLNGAFLMARAVAPGMTSRGYGRIVTISSGAGLGVSLTGIQAYAAAKAGEIGLTRQLAHELGQHGITVNSVAPGFIRSNAASERQWRAYGEEEQQRMVERIAMRRTGRVEDISNAVLFLSSDQASWITGQVLSVDGGK